MCQQALLLYFLLQFSPMHRYSLGQQLRVHA
jgi:hypothetical protein